MLTPRRAYRGIVFPWPQFIGREFCPSWHYWQTNGGGRQICLAQCTATVLVRLWNEQLSSKEGTEVNNIEIGGENFKNFAVEEAAQSQTVNFHG